MTKVLWFFLAFYQTDGQKWQRGGRKQNPGQGNSRPGSPVATSIRNNGLDIMFSQVEPDKNMVISPMSIVGCMYMLAAGSAGETREEILTALDFGSIFGNGSTVDMLKKPFEEYRKIMTEMTSSSEEGYTLNIANGMFFQEGMSEYRRGNELDTKYVDLLKENFIQDVTNIQDVNFAEGGEQATEEINQWIAQETKNKIPQLFGEPIPTDTLVILASTLYFKSSWAEKFKVMSDKEAQSQCWTKTVEDIQNGECAEGVTWMQKTDKVPFHQLKSSMGKVNVFEIPLRAEGNSDGDTNKMTMQIWSPSDAIITDGKTDADFRQLIKSQIGTIRSKRGMARKTKCKIVMPKFSMEYKDDIVDSLKAIGIEKVFSQTVADLSPMLGDSNDAYVKNVNHAVKLDVDENGIEGAAVTTAQISSRTYTPPTILSLTKPFYFVITNRCWTADQKRCAYSNIPIFIGRVVDP